MKLSNLKKLHLGNSENYELGWRSVPQLYLLAWFPLYMAKRGRKKCLWWIPVPPGNTMFTWRKWSYHSFPTHFFIFFSTTSIWLWLKMRLPNNQPNLLLYLWLPRLTPNLAQAPAEKNCQKIGGLPRGEFDIFIPWHEWTWRLPRLRSMSPKKDMSDPGSKKLPKQRIKVWWSRVTRENCVIWIIHWDSTHLGKVFSYCGLANLWQKLQTKCIQTSQKWLA